MAYTGFRQVQFRRGATSLDLTSAPYKAVAGSWTSAGRNLEFKILIQGTTLAEVERYLDDVQRWLTLAQSCDQRLLSELVQIRTKVCDCVPQTADLGATWRVKTLRGGTLMPGDPSESAQGQYMVQATLSLDVTENWRRAAPEPVLEATTAVGLTIRSDGGITSNAVALTARRMAWTATTGVTVRYRWLAAAANCDFFKLPGTTIKAWWDNANRRFKIVDGAGTSAQSSQYTFTVGQEVDVVFRWAPGSGMAIWVNGTADGSVASCAFAAAETATVFEPTGTQTILSAQVWPAALTNEQCAGLAGWGRPEAELPVLITPPNAYNTNALYRLYNAPGTAPGPLRVLASGTSFDQVRLGLRTLRMTTPVTLECEDGTAGAATVKTADTSASKGQMMRFTPTATGWATRVTVVLAATAADLQKYLGDHRLFLACYDAATNVNVNQVRYRVIVAGVAGDWSDAVSCTLVATRSLIELGALTLPPGGWPAEAEAATTTGYGANYATVEVQAQNTVGSGGGALDLDALYLFPAEAEGVAACPAYNSGTQFVALDWSGELPTGILVYDKRSLEFGGWADWEGHDLTLIPVAGEAGVLAGYGYAGTGEQANPNDTLTLMLYYEPRWW